MNSDDLKPVVSLAEVNKQKIIRLFIENVKGRKADISLSNIKHDGKAGHWLETAMGVKHNGDNAPDILGYEMKNSTKLKTTFGDWSPDYFIFKSFKGKPPKITRDQFFEIFGRPNLKKDGRLSWSGDVTPKMGKFNFYGQRLVVDTNKNIVAIYRYSRDQRPNKDDIVPPIFRKEMLILAAWTAAMMKTKVENKFDKHGWFKCETDKNGVYTHIAFGPRITFDMWLNSVKSRDIIFDTAMYQGNRRPYCQWRAVNSFWDNLVVEKY